MSMIRRNDCACSNDWKNKLNQLWERYQSTIRRIKANGTVIAPDGDGIADITELIESVTVDDALDTSSTNPVENRVIANAINGIETDIDDLETSVDGLSEVARTGDYDDLSNKPTIPAAQVNADWNATEGVAEILNKPTIPAAQVNSDWDAASGVAQILNKPVLADVATTGSYNDLTDKPIIPPGSVLYPGTGQNTDGAITQKGTTDALALKQDALTFDTTPIANSNNPVTSGGIKNALDTKQDSLTFDTTPIANSNNPVTSGGIYDAIQNVPGAVVKKIMYDPATDAIAMYQKLVELHTEDPTRILKVYFKITYNHSSVTDIFTGTVDLFRTQRATGSYNYDRFTGNFFTSSSTSEMIYIWINGNQPAGSRPNQIWSSSGSVTEIGIVYI